MCKRHTHHEQNVYADTTTPTVYDGDTVRLSDQRPTRRHCGGGFPWWTLWLIWPAIGLFKLIAANAVSVVGSVSSVTALQIIAAVLLIVAGVVLLRRDRADRSEQWHQ